MSLELCQIATVLCVVTGYLFYIRRRSSSHGLPLLRGPRPLPFLGNLCQIPLKFPEKTFAKWAKTYDAIYVQLFHRPILILNTLGAAQELLENRASKYSDRPSLIFMNQFVFSRAFIALVPYNEKLRKLRRWFQASLESKAVLGSYYPMQRRHVNDLLLELAQTPDDFISHIKRYTAAFTIEITYGYDIPTEREEFMKLADTTMARLSSLGSLSTSLVDLFPILQYIPTWMPGGGFKREAFLVRDLVADMMDRPYRKACEKIAAGIATPSFTAFITEQISKDGHLTEEDECDVKGSAFALYGAGFDTSMTTLTTFMLAMTLHPEVLQKAQAEIDRVIGSSRLPELSDRDALPYLECVIKETHRWNPPLPLGLPHGIRDQDSYRDCVISGGATVPSNIWAMTRDETMYPDPEAFNPEKFEVMDASTARQRDPRKIIFGFGRRICPGCYLADSTVWLAAASITACMNIGKARDSAGNAIDPTRSFKSGVISHVTPFKCEIRARRKDVVNIIMQHNAKEDI